MNNDDACLELPVKGGLLGGRTAVSVIFTALVISIVLNVFLARDLREKAQSQTARTTSHLLAIGAAVPQIAATRLDGKQELISYRDAEQATILYFFKPTCVWCERNMSNLKTLQETTRGRYRLLGVSLSNEGLQAYVATNNLNFPIYSQLSPEALKACKFAGTPQTIVVSADGHVLQNWVGAYVGNQKSQVEDFFHISLPGIQAKKGAD